eukprot:Seg2319.4 transcript_id=Seg2319.4/GoldUCD/mRNA.D3Y31 product="hypothetical protein" protein_id=Seg2319.4/GoldUCD/D3Y31
MAARQPRDTRGARQFSSGEGGAVKKTVARTTARTGQLSPDRGGAIKRTATRIISPRPLQPRTTSRTDQLSPDKDGAVERTMARTSSQGQPGTTTVTSQLSPDKGGAMKRTATRIMMISPLQPRTPSRTDQLSPDKDGTVERTVARTASQGQPGTTTRTGQSSPDKDGAIKKPVARTASRGQPGEKFRTPQLSSGKGRPVDTGKAKDQTSKKPRLDASKTSGSQGNNDECFGKGFVDFQRTFGLDIEMQAMTQLERVKELQKNGSMKDLTLFVLKNELEKYKQEKAHAVHSQDIKKAVAQNDGDYTSKVIRRNKGWQERAVADKRLLLSSHGNASCQGIYCPMRATIESIQGEIESLRDAFSAYGTCQHPNAMSQGSAQSRDVPGCSEPQALEDASSSKAPSVASDASEGWFENAKSMLDVQQQQLGVIKQVMEKNNSVVSEWITEMSSRIKGIDSAQKDMYVMLFEHIESENERQDQTKSSKNIDDIQDKGNARGNILETTKREKQRVGFQRESKLLAPKMRKKAIDPFSAEGRRLLESNEVVKKKSFVKEATSTGSSESDKKGTAIGTGPRSRLNCYSALNKSTSSLTKKGNPRDSQPKVGGTKRGKSPLREDIRGQVIDEIDDFGDQEELLRKQSQEILDQKGQSGNVDLGEEYELTEVEKKFLKSLTGKGARFVPRRRTIGVMTEGRHMSSNQGEIRKLQKKVKILQEECEKIRKANNEYRKEIYSNNMGGFMAEAEVRVANSKIECLSETIVLREEERTTLNQEMNDLKIRVTDLNDKLSRCNEEKNKLENYNKDLKENIEDKNAKIEALRRRLEIETATAREERGSISISEMEGLQEELTSCREERKTLETDNKALNEEIALLKKQNLGRSFVMAEIQELRNEMKSCTYEKYALEMYNNRLSGKVELIKQQLEEQIARGKEYRKEIPDEQEVIKKFIDELVEVTAQRSVETAKIEIEAEERLTLERKIWEYERKIMKREQEMPTELNDAEVGTRQEESLNLETKMWKEKLNELYELKQLWQEDQQYKLNRKLMFLMTAEPSRMGSAEIVTDMTSQIDKNKEECSKEDLKEKASLLNFEVTEAVVKDLHEIIDSKSEENLVEDQKMNGFLPPRNAKISTKDEDQIQMKQFLEELESDNEETNRFLPPRNGKISTADKDKLIELQRNLEKVQCENEELQEDICLFITERTINRAISDLQHEKELNKKKPRKEEELVESENDTLRMRRRTGDEKCKEIGYLKEKMKIMQKEMEKIKEERDEMRSRHHDDSEKIRNLMQEINELTLVQETFEKKSKTNELELTNEITNLNTELDVLRNRDKDSTETIAKFQDEVDFMLSELDHNHQDLKSKEENLRRISNELKEVKEERDELRKKVGGLKGQTGKSNQEPNMEIKKLKDQCDEEKADNLRKISIKYREIEKERDELMGKLNDQRLKNVLELGMKKTAAETQQKELINKVTFENEELRQSLASKENHLSILSKEVSEKNDELKGMMKETENLRRKVDELNDKIVKNIQEESMEKTALETQRDNLIRKLKDQYDKEKKEDLCEISMKCKELEKERDELLRKNILESSMKNTAVETQQTELITRLRVENNNLRSNLATKENHLSIISKELSEKNHKHENEEKSEKELLRISNELREIQKQRDELKRKVNELHDQTAEKIKKENMEKSEWETEKQNLIKKLKDQYDEEKEDDLRRMSIKFREIEKERDELKRKVNDQRLKNVLESGMKKTAIETHQNELIKSLKDQNDHLRSNLATKENHLSILSKQLSGKDDELRQMRKEIDNMKMKVEELSDKIVKNIGEEIMEKTDLETQKDTMIRKLRFEHEEEKAEDLRRITVKYREIEKERDELIRKLNDQRLKNITGLGMRKTAVEIQQNETIRDLQNQNDYLRKSLATKEKHLSILSIEISEKNDELKGMVKEINNLKKKVEELNNKIIENIGEEIMEKTDLETQKDTMIRKLRFEYEEEKAEDLHRITVKYREIEKERDELIRKLNDQRLKNITGSGMKKTAVETHQNELIEDLQNQNDYLRKSLATKEKHLSILSIEISEKNEDLRGMGKEMDNLKTKVDELSDKIVKKTLAETMEKTAWATQKSGLIGKLKGLQKANIKYRVIEKERDELKKRVNDQRMKNVLEASTKATTEETQQNDMIKSLRDENDHLRKSLVMKDNHSSILSEELSQKDDELRQMRKEIDSLKRNVEGLNDKVVKSIREESLEKTAWETEKQDLIRKLKDQHNKEKEQDLCRISKELKEVKEERDILKRKVDEEKNIQEAKVEKTGGETSKDDLIKNLKDQSDDLRNSLALKENHLSKLSKELSERKNEHVDDGDKEKNFRRIGHELKQLKAECREMTSEVKHLCHIVSKYITDVSIARSLAQSGVDSSEAECNESRQNSAKSCHAHLNHANPEFNKSRPSSAKSSEVHMNYPLPRVKDEADPEWPKIVVTQSSHSKLHPVEVTEDKVDGDPMSMNGKENLEDFLLKSAASAQRLRKSSRSGSIRNLSAVSSTEKVRRASNENLLTDKTSRVTRRWKSKHDHSDVSRTRSAASVKQQFSPASNETTSAEAGDYEIGFAEVKSGRFIDCASSFGFAEMVTRDESESSVACLHEASLALEPLDPTKGARRRTPLPGVSKPARSKRKTKRLEKK